MIVDDDIIENQIEKVVRFQKINDENSNEEFND